jgi:lipopolysaccharide biosynthesis protein
VASLFAYLFDNKRKLSDFQFGDNHGKKGQSFVSGSSREATVVITAHIYYEEFLKLFLSQVPFIKDRATLLVTTTHPRFHDLISNEFRKLNVNGEVRLTENRGRNFAPLLVEFSDEVLKNDFLLHVHSKRSNHAGQDIGTQWMSRGANLLLQPTNIERTLNLFGQMQNAALVYPACFDLLRKINFRWGTSKRVTKRFFEGRKGFEKIPWKGPIDFPAGGMFAVRVSAVKEIFEIDWKYSDFPPELGQLDGTLQHGLERMLGALVMAKGLQQFAFSQEGENHLFLET